MHIYNTMAIRRLLGDGSYTHIRIKNLFNGVRGRAKKRDIQEVRKILREQYQLMDRKLTQLEHEL